MESTRKIRPGIDSNIVPRVIQPPEPLAKHQVVASFVPSSHIVLGAYVPVVAALVVQDGV